MPSSPLVNFWNTLPVGFTVLAPMEDVTDTVFRRLIGLWGAPDVFMSEFINSTELVHSKRRFAKQHAYLDSKELADLQRPLVAQIWGNEPDDYRQAIPRLLEAGFVGIDINMGCPAVKVVRRGSCAGLIDLPAQAGELIQAAQEACGTAPVSVKTRLGVKEKKTLEWAGFLLGRNLAALTIHGRIATQMSEGEADWNEIASVVQLREELGSTTRIIGNGDLRSREDLARRQKQSGVDGLMVGRGIFYDPLLFRTDGRRFEELPPAEKVKMMMLHLREQQRVWEGHKGYDLVKSFYKIYTRGWEGGEELRDRLYQTRSYGEATEILEQWQL